MGGAKGSVAHFGSVRLNLYEGLEKRENGSVGDVENFSAWRAIR